MLAFLLFLLAFVAFVAGVFLALVGFSIYPEKANGQSNNNDPEFLYWCGGGVALLLLAWLFCSSGCGLRDKNKPEETVAENHYAEAIQSVIDQDHALSDRYVANNPDVNASDLRQLVEQMARIDLRECPLEFQQAYVRHKNAWDQAASYVAKYEGFEGGVRYFVEGLTGSSAGLEEEGRIQRDIQETWYYVEEVALKYGVRIY